MYVLSNDTMILTTAMLSLRSSSFGVFSIIGTISVSRYDKARPVPPHHRKKRGKNVDVETRMQQATKFFFSSFSSWLSLKLTTLKNKSFDTTVGV